MVDRLLLQVVFLVQDDDDAMMDYSSTCNYDVVYLKGSALDMVRPLIEQCL